VTTDSAAVLRALVDDAVARRPAPVTGRVRFSVVGLDEVRFCVELRPEGSRVCDDDGAAPDAALWVRRDDVAHLVNGFSLAGVRQAGRADLVVALAALLAPGKSPLGVRLGARDGR
jgi:hypothetical protein